MFTRRSFLKNASLLGTHLAQSTGAMIPWSALANSKRPHKLHHKPQAKSVIFLVMSGGVSQVDTFDPKPALKKYHGKPYPGKGAISSFNRQPGLVLKSPFQFSQKGQSGAWVSEIFPHLSQVIDQVSFIKSCTNSTNNHSPALLKLHSGHTTLGHPSIGSWINYALGSENSNLPGHIVMIDHRGAPINESTNWTNAFLPSNHAGLALLPGPNPILNLKRHQQITAQEQAEQIKLMASLSHINRQKFSGRDIYKDMRVEMTHLASRMMQDAPKVLDITQESAATKKLYGINKKTTDYFGRQLLTARRLVESGVRFIEVISGAGGSPNLNWDAHSDITQHSQRASETDQPIAGLILDLKKRGLLQQTLVVWTGEFGRLPISEGKSGKGRDHNPKAFTSWMAGAGVQGGTSLGQTDEFGLEVIQDKVDIHDLHATILHQLGIDHTLLTFRHNGRDFRPTDTGGNVLKQILSQPPRGT